MLPVLGQRDVSKEAKIRIKNEGHKRGICVSLLGHTIARTISKLRILKVETFSVCYISKTPLPKSVETGLSGDGNFVGIWKRSGVHGQRAVRCSGGLLGWLVLRQVKRRFAHAMKQSGMAPANRSETRRSDPRAVPEYARVTRGTGARSEPLHQPHQVPAAEPSKHVPMRGVERGMVAARPTPRSERSERGLRCVVCTVRQW